MTGTEQLREDMAYVRAAASRAGSVHVRPSTSYGP